MAVIAGLLIGNETWELQERSLKSLRACNPDQEIILYYSIGEQSTDIIAALKDLNVEAVDIGKPGLIGSMSSAAYSAYSTLEFNIKTSFKWLAILGAMSTKHDDVIFVDADIAIISPLPFPTFEEIWKYYDIFVQDEGNHIFPKHPCTGFIGFKYNEPNLAALQALHKEQCSAIVSGESHHDQTIFWQYISRDIDFYKKIYFMPQMLFPVGYMAPIYARSAEKDLAFLGKQTDPIIYHANWVVGIQAKANLMDAMLGGDKNEGDET